MRVEGGTSNMINGVSRQPSEIRLTSQLEESINQFPTVIGGLKPRNPTQRIGAIGSSKPAASITHLIERDNQEKYIVTLSPSGITVHDLAGNAKTVNAPNGFGYLGGATVQDLEALSVADHTFILNKKKQVKASTVNSPAYTYGGLIHVVQGDYFTEYIIYIDGQIAARYKTHGGVYNDDWLARDAEAMTKPRAIVNRLVFGANGQPVHTGTIVTWLKDTIDADYHIAIYDNVIYLRRKDGADFTLTADGGNETRMRAHKGSSPNFAELPRRAPNGFSLKITGSQETSWDDYYVKYVQETGAAQGRWKETVASSIPIKLDGSTMPHILVREANGTFTFKQAE